MPPIYLDYNASTPLLPVVIEAMKPYLESFYGNPSSAHWYGLQTRMAVAKARRQMAELLECKPEEIIFTSGGSESNNLAIKGVAFARKDKGRHIITSAIEHPAVTEVCRHLQAHGFEITYLPVNDEGRVQPEDLERAIRRDTILISIMHTNNETGVIQPLEELSAIARDHHIPFHTDAAQSVGKIPVKVNRLQVELLSIAGHKFYAPKGIGALYLRTGTTIEKLIHGASHEFNLRAGTENVALIAGIGAAAEWIQGHLDETANHLSTLRDRLENSLMEALSGQVRVNGHREKRLPNTLNISFYGIQAATLLDELKDTLAASAGAACHSDSVTLSHVLEAMHVPKEWGAGAIRFSTGVMTTLDEIHKAAESIIKAYQRLTDKEATTVIVSDERIQLTHYTHGLGCACKMRPQDLEKILHKLPPNLDKKILVGADTFDDAFVYAIDQNTAIVQTVDFFTPIVDDPFDFGAIAAVNALSDIYAMGAKPLWALNLAAFPVKRLPLTVLEEILQGAQSIATKAGVIIGGGHTIEDNEPKFGMAVSGIIHPNRILRNHTVQEGDRLFISKAIGTGIATTALKRGMISQSDFEPIRQSMLTLNDTILTLIEYFPISACTDVTGFGLLGHLWEMTGKGKFGAVISASSIPVFDGIRELVMMDIVPGGSIHNLEYVQPHIEWSKHLTRIDQIILCDAQTSGGLLFTVAEKFEMSLQSFCAERNLPVKQIGQITRDEKIKIV